MELMDISKELELIENRRWNKSTLKASATTIIFALKALTEYAGSSNKDIGDISPMELLHNIIDLDIKSSDY
jgi:hypothetical protein